MSQTLTTTTIASPLKSRLTLDIPTIHELLPSLEPGEFAVLNGSSAASYLASLLCVRAQLPAQLGGLASKAIFVDGGGGNTFRLYQITKIAQLLDLNPTQVLKQISIARAFTAYQMTCLIMDKLCEAAEVLGAKFMVVSDIAGTFLDEKMHADEEAIGIYSQVAAHLSALARQKDMIIVATYLPHEQTSRNSALRALTQQNASVVASFRTSKYHREFVLDKHPRYNVGSVQFPSSQPTLPEFLGGFN